MRQTRVRAGRSAVQRMLESQVATTWLHSGSGLTRKQHAGEVAAAAHPPVQHEFTACFPCNTQPLRMLHCVRHTVRCTCVAVHSFKGTWSSCSCYAGYV